MQENKEGSNAERKYKGNEATRGSVGRKGKESKGGEQWRIQTLS